MEQAGGRRTSAEDYAGLSEEANAGRRRSQGDRKDLFAPENLSSRLKKQAEFG